MRTCDVAIVGLGIMGSAALHNLTRRGVDALGFDPLAPGERKGSSHGSCRVFRRYNFESPAYTTLSEQAFDAWSELERSSGETVLLPASVVEAGAPGSALVRDSRAAAGCAVAGPAQGWEVNAQYPAFGLPDDWDVVVHDSGGILRADVALRLFRQGSADRIVRQAVSVKRTARNIILTAADGERCAAKTLIIAAGPWVTDFVPALRDYITVTRQAVGWFQPSAPSKAGHGALPIFLLEAPGGIIYGFPNFEGQGVKAGAHDHGRVLARADDALQDASDQDLASTRAALAAYLPAAHGPLIRREICLYTNTRGGDVDGSMAEEFILDRLPDDPRVIVASPCSGHGFKFASAIGQILADMATSNRGSGHPEFRLSRFAPFA